MSHFFFFFAFGFTNVTGAELEELTDGSETTLHTHVGDDTDELVGIDAVATPGYLGAAANDGILRTSTGLDYADGGDFVTLSAITDAVVNGGPSLATGDQIYDFVIGLGYSTTLGTVT